MSGRNYMTEVKRGMVFYMDVPSKDQPVPLPGEYAISKKRPYIVISSDEQNVYSNLVHVAPITTKPSDKPRWYRVPFRASDGTYRWVLISHLMLVPKEYCTVADMSEALTNVCLNNKELTQRLNESIFKLLGVTYNEPETIKEETKMETKLETTNLEPIVQVSGVTPQMVIPNINITINIPGLGDFVKTVTTETKTEPVKEVPIETPTTSVEKPVETVKSCTCRTSVKKRTTTPKGKRGRTTFSPSERTEIFNYLMRHAKQFGGTLSLTKCAENLGISISTAFRYANRIMDNNDTFCR